MYGQFPKISKNRQKEILTQVCWLPYHVYFLLTYYHAVKNLCLLMSMCKKLGDCTSNLTSSFKVKENSAQLMLDNG